MTPDHSYDRRSVLRAAGVLSMGALAGCTGGNGGGGGGEPEYETVSEEEEPDYGGWFDATGNYAGTAEFRGESEVTVTVGAGRRGRSVSPAAIMVDPGTTVVWEWTGAGGGHNVVAENGTYESPIEVEEGYTFKRTFEESGTSLYTCIPHDAQGMRGAVAVDG